MIESDTVAGVVYLIRNCTAEFEHALISDCDLRDSRSTIRSIRSEISELQRALADSDSMLVDIAAGLPEDE